MVGNNTHAEANTLTNSDIAYFLEIIKRDHGKFSSCSKET